MCSIRLEGDKFNKAREWKIPCVNVQWLHDVLFGHYEALQLPTAQKYQQFNLDDPFKVDYALVPHLMGEETDTTVDLCFVLVKTSNYIIFVRLQRRGECPSECQKNAGRFDNILALGNVTKFFFQML